MACYFIKKTSLIDKEKEKEKEISHSELITSMGYKTKLILFYPDT